MKKKKEKKQSIKKNKGRDFVVFLIIAFAMVFLTSSFIVEDVYNYADKIKMTPEGIKEVYSASIGEKTFADEVKGNENQNKKSDSKPEATPTPSTKSTPAT
ncbi:MAG: hypothetical protein RR310_03530 [Eubacterium sp.]